MAPQTKVEFVILRMSYYPIVHPQSPLILTKQQKQMPTSPAPHVIEWFDRVLSYETSKVPSYLNVIYSEWKIKSNNQHMFTVKGHRYDRILLVLGEDVVHWVFYENNCVNARMEGWARLALNYCGCCLNRQYRNIIQSVLSCVHKKSLPH